MSSQRIFILDSRVSSTSLRRSSNGLGESTGRDPLGVFLHLIGKDENGRSVVAELGSKQGVQLRLMDAPDEKRAALELYRRASLQQAKFNALFCHAAFFEGTELRTHIQDGWRGSSSYQYCLFDVKRERRPAFYGFVPENSNSMVPKQRDIAVLTMHGVHSLAVYYKLKRAADEALHDRPLACGAVPVELHQPLNVVLLEVEFGLRQGAWCELDVKTMQIGRESGSDVELICKSARHVDSNDLPILRVASWDIETSTGKPKADGTWSVACNPSQPDHAIICIAVVTCDLERGGVPIATDAWRRRFFFWSKKITKAPLTYQADVEATIAGDELDAFASGDRIKHESENSPVEVVHCTSECDLLRRFASYLRTQKVDMLLSYNGTQFDLPYIQQRIEILKKKANACRQTELWDWWGWGRFASESRAPRRKGPPPTEEEIKQMARARNQGRMVLQPTAFDHIGVAAFDVLDYVKTLNLESAKLKDASSFLFGDHDSKIDLDYTEMFQLAFDDTVAGWAQIAVYNVRDCLMPLRILLKKKQIGYALQLHQVTGCSLGDITNGGQSKRLLAMVAREVRTRNMVYNQPTKLDFPKMPWLSGGGAKVKGASVLEIEPGYYRDGPVVTCDYSSKRNAMRMRHSRVPPSPRASCAPPPVPTPAE